MCTVISSEATPGGKGLHRRAGPQNIHIGRRQLGGRAHPGPGGTVAHGLSQAARMNHATLNHILLWNVSVVDAARLLPPSPLRPARVRMHATTHARTRPAPRGSPVGRSMTMPGCCWHISQSGVKQAEDATIRVVLNQSNPMLTLTEAYARMVADHAVGSSASCVPSTDAVVEGNGEPVNVVKRAHSMLMRWTTEDEDDESEYVVGIALAVVFGLLTLVGAVFTARKVYRAMFAEKPRHAGQPARLPLCALSYRQSARRGEAASALDARECSLTRGRELGRGAAWETRRCSQRGALPRSAPRLPWC